MLKILLSFILVCPFLHSLQLNRVILSTNNDPLYIEFWPIVAPIWQAMGLRPTLALIAHEDCPIDTSIGDVIRFDPIPGIPESLQTQVIRLFLPSLFPEDSCLISDIDMLPISQAYFVEHALVCPDNAFLVYRDRVSDYGYARYPMCYIAAKGSVFRSVFEMDRYPNIEAIIRDFAGRSYGWNTDEIMLHLCLLDWERKGGHVVRLGHDVEARLDRGSWAKIDLNTVDYSKYIDCHCPRPYSKYKDSIDRVVAGIWKLLAPEIPIVSLPKPMNEWQHLDPKTGLVLPWFTKPFLDVLQTWDIKNWDIFEWGTGYSTVWLAAHCKSIVSIDSDKQWTVQTQALLQQLGYSNATFKTRTPSLPYSIGCGGEESAYVKAINEDDRLYDCIIIDGEWHRNSCALHVLKHIKEDGIIILDNPNQTSVGLDSSPTFELLKDFEHFSFLQPGHRDWRTDYWIIRKQRN